MFGRKKQSISKKYILILIIILIILLLIIFSFTLKEDRKLSKAESLLKDGLIYSEKIITYPFNYIKENIKDREDFDEELVKLLGKKKIEEVKNEEVNISEDDYFDPKNIIVDD